MGKAELARTAVARPCLRSIGTTGSRLRGLTGRIIGGHRVTQALRPHVGPVLLDVFDAGSPAVLAEPPPPSGGDLGESRPQGVLLLVVDQNEEAAVLVVEGIGAHFTSLDTGACTETLGRARQRCFDPSKVDVTRGRLPGPREEIEQDLV